MFILECLGRLNRPVFWVDVDGRIMRRPDFLRGLSVDFAAHPKPADSPRRWHVCAMYFTPAAKWFVQGWIDELKDWSDELALQEYWERGPQISHCELPDDYFVIPKRPAEYPPTAVYVIGISESEQKKEFKARRNGH